MRNLLVGVLLALSYSIWANGESESAIQTRSQQDDKQESKTGNEQAPKNSGASRPLPTMAVQSIAKPENEKPKPHRASEDRWYDTFLDHPTEWLLAVFNALLVLYTARLWTATRALQKGAERTAERQLRAYVALEHIEFIGGPRNLKIRIRNYGQTPAHQMSIWTWSHEGEQPQGFGYPYPQGEPTVAEQMLHPNQDFSTVASLHLPYGANTPGFFPYGRMVYRDIFDNWWVTKFCYLYEGENVFVPHGEYNKENGPYQTQQDAIAATA